MKKKKQPNNKMTQNQQNKQTRKKPKTKKGIARLQHSFLFVTKPNKFLSLT